MGRADKTIEEEENAHQEERKLNKVSPKYRPIKESHGMGD